VRILTSYLSTGPYCHQILGFYAARSAPLIDLGPKLLAKSHAGHEVGDAPMTFAEFQGRAWQAANDKARELEWIV
jgi:hypothetical protein